MGGIRNVAIPAAASAAAALAASFVIGGVGSGRGDEPTVSDEVTSSARSEGTATEAPRGSSEATPSQPQAADLPALGIQFHGTWRFYDDAKRAAVLDQIEASGATWVRLDVSWSMIQPSPDGFDEDGYGVSLVDDVIDQLRARDLQVLVMFWRTPAWASGDMTTENRAPTDPADYATALQWAGERWGDVVDAWQIWNEPNLDYFLAGSDPAAYTRLLCAGAGAVRAGDPGAKVVFGGVVNPQISWVRQAYAAGAKDCFDVMGVHSYPVPGDLPPTNSNADVTDLGSIADVHDLMRSQGDRAPIWLTEFGWSAHTDAPDTEAWRRGVTEEQQATYAGEALEILARDLPFVTQAFWYKDVVNPDSTDMQQEGFAMLREDLSPRPVFDTFRRLYRRD